MLLLPTAVQIHQKEKHLKLTTIFVSMFALSCFAFAQGQEKKFIKATAHQVSPKDIPTLPIGANLPPIPNTVISLIGMPNGLQTATVFVVTQVSTGTFTVVGNTNDGQQWKLSTWSFADPFPTGTSGIFWVQSGDLSAILTGFTGFASYDVYHEDGGSFEKSTAVVNPGNPLVVTAASTLNGVTVVNFSGPFSQDVIVSVGFTGAFGLFTPAYTGGASATFPANVGLSSGSNSITVCAQGSCRTGTFFLYQ
jgi:hypothetical protein